MLDVEAELDDIDISGWRWTLTWREGKPIVELDDGTTIRYDSVSGTATIIDTGDAQKTDQNKVGCDSGTTREAVPGANSSEMSERPGRSPLPFRKPAIPSALERTPPVAGSSRPRSRPCLRMSGLIRAASHLRYPTGA